MPMIPFDEENRREDPYKFPKLHLDQNDVARILLPQKNPIGEFTHTIQEPVLVGGQGVRETRQTRDKTDYQAWREKFVARYICLGDYDTLKEKGIDPDLCPGCRFANEQQWLRNPVRRFAIHVIRYELQPKSWEPVMPLSVRVLGWGFTEGRYDEILTLKSTWGDLRAKDLLLGPCDNEMFQKFKIQIAPDAIYLRQDDWKELVVTTYQNNQYQLETLIGRRGTAEAMLNDLTAAQAKWNHVEGVPGAAAAVAADAPTAASVNFDDILAPPAPPVAPPAAAPAPVAPASAEPALVDDLASVSAAPAPAAAPGSEAVDFDDLLKSFKTEG